MTVGELIGKLKEFDPSTLLLVSGYEGNYESGVVVSKRAVMKYELAYHGDYDDYDTFFSEGEDVSPVEAVVIARDMRARGN